MTTGLDRIIKAINSELDHKIECIQLKHPDVSISPSEMTLIYSYRVQLIAKATQIYVIGSRAIADVINDVLNQVNQPIMRALNNALIPEQIEWVVTHGLYPDLIIDKEVITFIENLPKKTIDIIFKILAKENILQVISQIQQLEDLLKELYLATENIKVEDALPSMGAVNNTDIMDNHPEIIAAIGITGNDGSNCFF